MIMQHAEAGTIWCAEAVLAVQTQMNASDKEQDYERPGDSGRI